MPYADVLRRTLSVVFTVAECWLGVRFLIVLLGVNEALPVIRSLMLVSRWFLLPLHAIGPIVTKSGLVIEWSTLLAMGIYLLCGMIVHRFLRPFPLSHE